MNTVCVALVASVMSAAQPEAIKPEPSSIVTAVPAVPAMPATPATKDAPAQADVTPKASRLVANLATNPERSAIQAISGLRTLGVAAQPALETALDSKDMQQRHLAAKLLRSLNVPPSEQLRRMTHEGLAHDNLPRNAEADDGYVRLTLTNAINGAKCPSSHAAQAEPLLERGRDSADAQQQFLCAAAASAGNRERLRVRATRLLIPHLASNRIEGDAYLAAISIHRFGPAGLEDLRAWKETGVTQQRALVTQLIIKLEHPGDRAGNRRAAAEMGQLAQDVGLVEDAIADLSFDTTEFYWESPPDPSKPRATPMERDENAHG